MRSAAYVAVWLLVLPLPAIAHPAPFSYLDLRLDAARTHGSLVLHDFDIAHDLGIARPETLADPAVAASHRDVLMRLMSTRLSLILDGQPRAIEWTGLEVVPDRQSVRLTFTVAGSRPGMARIVALLFPYDPIHQTFVNVYEEGELRHQTILDDRRRSADYYAGTFQGRLAVVETFVIAGMEHILIGPDHVLFLIGLMLLGGSLPRLAAIVTAFTIGHSITLSLAALDIFSPPSRIIEPAIALSIVFVGADNLLVQRQKREAAPRDIRPYVAGVFGLVHGFGFATVLREFGLPAAALGWSLFSFNLGVEIGQLAIVLVVASVLMAIRRRSSRLGERLAFAGSILVIAAGGYWFVERVFLTGGV
jgi:hydrogenase/urease accessory protein HupE